MQTTLQCRRGQALLMVTLSLFTICGVLGLAVDLGWAYFVKKAARAAADGGALAGARKAYSIAGSGGSYTCGGNVDCQPTPVNCSTIQPSSNLYNACLYAAQNFHTGAPASRQTLLVSSGTNSPFVTATGPVEVKYWVTVTAQESIPQLFSAVMGNTWATSAASATAAVVVQTVNGSLVLLNRRADLAQFGNTAYYGTNLLVQANDNQGTYALQTGGPIVMASTCNGSSLGSGDCRAGSQSTYAGVNQGGGTVFAPSTSIAGSGGYSLQGSSQWVQTPNNNGPTVDDPMRGKGQPEVPSGTLPEIPVPNGVLDSSICPNGVCTPGRYYATGSVSCGHGCTQQVATGIPLQLAANLHFAFCNGCDPTQNFGTFIFFGGLTGGGSGTTATFDPGMYVLAGTKPTNNGPGALLNTATNVNLLDNTTSTGANTGDAGELFVFTGVDSSGSFRYPGLSAHVPTLVANSSSNFQMGTVNVQSGNNATTVNLHGLNKSFAGQLGGLTDFAPALFWQDQANSTVKYTANGYVDYSSCGGGHSLNNPCTNTLANTASPELDIQASPNIHLYGTIYQPRGAWTTLIGGGGYAGPLQIITGAVNVQGNAHIDMLGLVQPMSGITGALIE